MMDDVFYDWFLAWDKLEEAKAKVERCRERADAAPLPKCLRPATPADIVENAIIWYPEYGQEAGGDYDAVPCWSVVEEVLYPSDEFKAYCADDGCRYGLNGAFVEVED